MSNSDKNEPIYEYVEDVDVYIEELISKTGDKDEKDVLRDIKKWPDYAKTKWLLTSEESQVKPRGAGGCLAIVATVVTVVYYVWVWITETDDQGNNTKKKIQERRERLEEVQKMVHTQAHKNGKCPDK